MFRMIIEIDENRMKHDGLDNIKLMNELDKLIKDIPEIQEKEKGIFETDDSGARSWLLEQLEECEWFMKYVCKWIIDDPAVYEDAIKTYRKMGLQCCYE